MGSENTRAGDHMELLLRHLQLCARTVCVLLSMMSASPLGATTVYRWVDEAGQIHYADRAPANHAVQRVNVPTGVTSVVAQQELKAVIEAQEARYEARVEQRAARTALQSVARDQAQRCSAARQRLEAIGNANRLFEIAADGTRQRLDEAARDLAIERAREEASAACETL